MSIQFFVSVGLLITEVALILWCIRIQKRPIDPLKPRLIPTNILMVVLSIAFLATAAHVVSLVTGHQLQPRKMKGM